MGSLAMSEQVARDENCVDAGTMVMLQTQYQDIKGCFSHFRI